MRKKQEQIENKVFNFHFNFLTKMNDIKSCSNYVSLFHLQSNLYNKQLFSYPKFICLQDDIRNRGYNQNINIIFMRLHN